MQSWFLFIHCRVVNMPIMPSKHLFWCYWCNCLCSMQCRYLSRKVCKLLYQFWHFKSLGATSASQCKPCKKGTYSLQGGSSERDCLSCPLGYYSQVEGATSVAVCVACPKGTYSSQVGDLSSCLPCARGSYSTLTGATSNSTCIACQEGKYTLSTGSDAPEKCILCPAGTFSTRGSIECTPCAPGFKSDQGML